MDDDRIAELYRKKQGIALELNDIREELNVIHARAVLDLARERDGTGKPLYANQETRRAALTIRLHDDEQFKDLKTRMRTLQADVEEIGLELNKLIPPAPGQYPL